MRIGELAAATGVGTATLRAWERRHGLLRPQRTAGGHRVYDMFDVARVRAVVDLAGSGVSLSVAVERVLTAGAPPPHAAVEDARARLWRSIDAFDEPGTKEALAVAGATIGVPVLLDEVLVPLLRRLGDEWRLSPRNIACEHFTSTLVRSHLVAMLPVRHEGGAGCLAFCPDDERHDIGLLMAAVMVATTGMSTVVLGAQTPVVSAELLLRELRPSVVLVAATARRTATRFLSSWRRSRSCLVVAGGAGFREGDEAALGGRVHLGPFTMLPDLVRRPAR